MRVCNFLDYESKSLSRQERLALILHATRRAQQQARGDAERQELEHVWRDCLAALSALPTLPSAEEAWLDRRMERMVRILKFYESGFIRLNRRYWWVLFALGMAILLLAILSGSPPDTSALM